MGVPRLPVFTESNKFHARRVEIDGLKFDSQGEANRWCELRYLERAGEIFELRRQVPFELHAGDRSNLASIGRIVLDFAYVQNFGTVEAPKHRQVVEDFKGLRTPLYRWKKKHLEIEYHLTVLETTDGRRR